jgi:hypothetical protein
VPGPPPAGLPPALRRPLPRRPRRLPRLLPLREPRRRGAAGGVRPELRVDARDPLCGSQIFNPSSMCAYATVSTHALRLCFEKSTRAIDPSKNQPNRLRCDRAREV